VILFYSFRCFSSCYRSSRSFRFLALLLASIYFPLLLLSRILLLILPLISLCFLGTRLLRLILCQSNTSFDPFGPFRASSLSHYHFRVLLPVCLYSFYLRLPIDVVSVGASSHVHCICSSTSSPYDCFVHDCYYYNIVRMKHAHSNACIKHVIFIIIFHI